MNTLDRRSFIKGSAAAAAGIAALKTSSLIAQESMISRPIPGTNEMIPIMGLGAPQPLRTMPEEGIELPMSLINAMIEKGGRFMDTSPFFRPDPPIVGEVMKQMGNIQNDLFLTAKITVDGREAGRQHMERSIANLNKDPMDLIMVHSMRDMHFHWPTIQEMKAEGKARYTGVSFARPNEMAYNNYANFGSLEAFMRAENPDFIMVPYSIHQQDISERILPLAQDMGTAVVIIEAFKTADDGGLFSLVSGKELPSFAADLDIHSWAQFSLKWIAAHPAVNCVITETSKAHHVVDNMGGGHGRLPDEAARKEMADYLLSLS